MNYLYLTTKINPFKGSEILGETGRNEKNIRNDEQKMQKKIEKKVKINNFF